MVWFMFNLKTEPILRKQIQEIDHSDVMQALFLATHSVMWADSFLPSLPLCFSPHHFLFLKLVLFLKSYFLFYTTKIFLIDASQNGKSWCNSVQSYNQYFQATLFYSPASFWLGFSLLVDLLSYCRQTLSKQLGKMVTRSSGLCCLENLFR